jgi:hypothetical protein
MKTLYERLYPQVIEMIEARRENHPATTEELIEHLEKYSFWTDLPYYILKTVYETVHGLTDEINETEIRKLFEPPPDDY